MAEYLHVKYKKVPLYHGYFVMIFTNSLKKSEKYLEGFDVQEPFADAYHHMFRGKHAFIIVINFDYDGRGITHGVIAHEVTHMVDMILGDRGVIADFVNDEAAAYLSEWITDQAYRFIHDLKFKIHLA